MQTWIALFRGITVYDFETRSLDLVVSPRGAGDYLRKIAFSVPRKFSTSTRSTDARPSVTGMRRAAR